MKQNDSDFLRRQAELCVALSRSTFDLTLATRLRAMAGELKAKAMQNDDDADALEPMRAVAATARA